MANEFNDVFFDNETETGPVGEARLYERPERIVTTAHPFNDADLRAFQNAGEHPGLD
jgi:hypothetical protein